jgi:hypothetical protein
MRMWSSHPDCKKIVEDCWSINVVGCSMFVSNKKLNLLKEKLKEWSKTFVGNVHDNMKQAELKLISIQDQIQLVGHTDVLLNE